MNTLVGVMAALVAAMFLWAAVLAWVKFDSIASSRLVGLGEYQSKEPPRTRDPFVLRRLRGPGAAWQVQRFKYRAGIPFFLLLGAVLFGFVAADAIV